MSARYSSGYTGELKRSQSKKVIAPKLKNTKPCSLCHQVVNEIKYHYDICEPCHQEEAEFDMDVGARKRNLTVAQENGYHSDEEDDGTGWVSAEESSDEDTVPVVSKDSKEPTDVHMEEKEAVSLLQVARPANSQNKSQPQPEKDTCLQGVRKVSSNVKPRKV